MPQDHPNPSTPPPAPRPAAGLPLDGPPPKPPALAWEERPAFREVFLIHFPPLAADAFREAGRHLYDAVLEHELREPEEPWVHGRVRALADPPGGGPSGQTPSAPSRGATPSPLTPGPGLP